MVKRLFAASVCLASVSFSADAVMSEAYWKIWNPEIQAKIDADIEAHRKADAAWPLQVKSGTEVKVEQMTHAFIFGAHIFNFNQLGKDEYNEKYKAVFGSLLNSATISFYWRRFELEEGKPRFKGEARDTAAFWNACPDPKNQPHWRRPASDPVVEFCESKGIRLHGHTLVWGNYKWQYPPWLLEKAGAELPFMKSDAHATAFADQIPKNMMAELKNYTPEQIAAMAPKFTRLLTEKVDQRITEIATYYKGRLHSWDVVNESATDFGLGVQIPGSPICKSHYGLMPGDYSYRAFQVAQKAFPAEVKLNINDYVTDQRYYSQVTNLLSRGCKIDIVGAQMHLFDPKTCFALADGKPIQTPQQNWERFALIGKAGKPIHLSEITITSGDNGPKGQAIQAVVARNLYRLWFSLGPMMGITWWNLVDDCGAPGEPSVSGIFTRDMQPKPAYFALNKLINEEWKTSLSVKADAQGCVKFRGFRGMYRLTWTDSAGKTQTQTMVLK